MSLFKSISSTQAEKLIKDSSDLIIIDVRRYSEFIFLIWHYYICFDIVWIGGF